MPLEEPQKVESPTQDVQEGDQWHVQTNVVK